MINEDMAFKEVALDGAYSYRWWNQDVAPFRSGAEWARAWALAWPAIGEAIRENYWHGVEATCDCPRVDRCERDRCGKCCYCGARFT
jgi:hypothetical protein